MYKDSHKANSLKAHLKKRFPEAEISLIIENDKGKKTFEPETLPDLSILAKDFSPEPIKISVFANGNLVRELFWTFETDQPKTQSKPERESMDPGQEAILKFMSLQEELTRQRIKQIEEMNQLRTEQLREHFREMLDSQKTLFKERLEWEKEQTKIEKEGSEEDPGIYLMRTLIDEVAPHTGRLVDALIGYLGKPKNQIKLVKPLVKK